VYESVKLRLPLYCGTDCSRIFTQPGRAETSYSLAWLIGQGPGTLGTDAHICDDREKESERILVDQGISGRVRGELGRSARELSR
jgi:hypothetical protein